MVKAKRGYSRAFKPRAGAQRIKFEADKVPPTLAKRVLAKIRRANAQGRRLSLRSLILTLLEGWVNRVEFENPPPE